MAAEAEQVVVAGNDDIGSCAHCASKYMIVVGVVLDDGLQRGRPDQDREREIAVQDLRDGAVGSMQPFRELLSCQDFFQLGNQCGAGEELNGPGSGGVKKLCGITASQEC